MINFNILWNNHPGFADLCDFDSQCAIRMGTALMKSGVDMGSFNGVKCWDKNHKKLNHTLRAQELANWMVEQISKFGYVDIKKNVAYTDYKNKDGIVFLKTVGVQQIILTYGMGMK